MTIRNDATRQRIATRERRRHRAVVARQGQVLLDTDFDQQARHQLERIEVETADSLGSPGRLAVPAGNAGFQATPDGAPANFNIGAGRGYLGGWLLENPSLCKLATQPHPRSGDAVSAPALIAVKALVRHVDPVEEPVLADVALGDAQASGRSLVDWQVFPLQVTAPLSCANALSRPEWISLAAPSSGTLAVLAQAAAPSNDPCSLTPGGGYTRLENLLYRLEVHGGTPKAGAPSIDGQRFGLAGLKIKLSRRNASLMVRITNIAGADFTVAPPTLDPRNWFAPGTFAEIVSIHDDVDQRAAFGNERLFRVATATDDHVILEASAQQIASTAAASDGTWFLRLWDAFPTGGGLETVALSQANPAESTEIELGDGLRIKLGGGAAATFRRGDYWTCAARADGSIDWPMVANVATPMPPHGPEIRYAPLAALSPAAGLEDCRIPFATLTDRALLYRGGDGQSAFAPAGAAMVELQGRLRVAVMRGETPVPNVPVRWSLPAGAPACQINGQALNAGASLEPQATDANGLVEVTWSIDAGQQLAVHKVQAAIALGPGLTSQPPVMFTATFDTALRTGYTPGQCVHLANVDNVQDALDVLCAKISDEPRAIALDSIVLLNSKAPIELIESDLIKNALEVPHTSFHQGIAFGFDAGMPDIAVAEFDPLVEVELDLPYPTTDPDRHYWVQAASSIVNNKRVTIEGPFGFQRVRLDGTVKLVDKGPQDRRGGLLWTPSAQAVRFIETAALHLWGQRANPEFASKLKEAGWLGTPRYERILCRIRLRSAMIWVGDGKPGGERVYLNAEHLGVAGKFSGRDLFRKEVDPQRAGDLDMFIYLVLPDFRPTLTLPLRAIERVRPG